MRKQVGPDYTRVRVFLRVVSCFDEWTSKEDTQGATKRDCIGGTAQTRAYQQEQEAMSDLTKYVNNRKRRTLISGSGVTLNSLMALNRVMPISRLVFFLSKPERRRG